MFLRARLIVIVDNRLLFPVFEILEGETLLAREQAARDEAEARRVWVDSFLLGIQPIVSHVDST